MSSKRPYPETYTATPFRAPRVVTLRDGSFLALPEPGFEHTDRVVLQQAAGAVAQEGFTGKGTTLVAPQGGVFRCSRGVRVIAGIWIDSGGRLWLAWSDERRIQVCRTRRPVTRLAALAKASAWERLTVSLEIPSGDGVNLHLGGGVLTPALHQGLLVSFLELPAGGVHLATVGPARQLKVKAVFSSRPCAPPRGPMVSKPHHVSMNWSPDGAGDLPGLGTTLTRMTVGASAAAHACLNAHPQNHAPTVALDPDGQVGHVVWTTEDLRICYRRFSLADLVGGRVQEEKPVEVWRHCHHADVASNGRQVVVCYTDHMKHIKYGYFDGANWQLDRHLTTLHPRFVETQQHSPWLWTDADGAIHLSFVCLTRCFVYDSKWQGDGFSDPQPVDGLFHPSLYVDEVRVKAERMSLERQTGTLLLSSSFLPERHGVYRQAPLAAAWRPDEPLLMLESAALDEVMNGTAHLEPMRLDPAQPILEPTGRKEDFDGSRVLSGGVVLKDGGRFRMWYGAVGLEPEPDVPWYDQVYVGYAESANGVDWQRTDTGNGMTYRGRPAPNRVANMNHNACVFIDPADEPARRYKAIKFESRAQRHDRISMTGEIGYLGLPRRGWLSTSPDGLRWTREEIVMDYPGPEPYELSPQGAIFDPVDPDPGRRYKVIGYSSLVGHRRCAGLAFSPDCRRWTAAVRHPALDSLMAVTPVRPAGPYAQIHDAGIARHGRYLLAFYQYQFDGHSADIRLAVSRDHGERFEFVLPESPLVPLGPAGDWNSGYLMTPSFVVDGDRMHVFFGANSDRPYETIHGMPMLRMGAGRVTALRDRFVGLSPRESGTMIVLTAPLSLPPPDKSLRFEANAKLTTGADLRAALVDADDPTRELRGFETAAATSVTGDSLRHRLTWLRNPALPSGLTRCRLRLTLRGAPADALYGLTLCQG